MPAPTLQILETADAAATIAADHLVRWITDARARSGGAHVALTGGLTPRDAYRHLAEVMDDWTGVHLWFGDERLVPITHQDANAWMVHGSLVEPAGIPDAQVHTVRTELGLDGAAADYTARVRSALPQNRAGIPVFDIVLLGLGEDGHIASLFPRHPRLNDRTSVAVAVDDSPKPPPERISLSLGVINAAHQRMVLTTGTAKADAVSHGMGAPDPNWPVSLLDPHRTVFVVDDAAATAIA